MGDDFLDLSGAVEVQTAQAAARVAVVQEILGYMAPHVEGLHVKERQFVSDMIYRRACEVAAGRPFLVSKAQLEWLVRIGYKNGFRLDDEEFWNKWRDVILRR